MTSKTTHLNNHESKSPNEQLKSEASWHQIIHAEIIAVTSAVRKNGRWLNTDTPQIGRLGQSMGLRTRGVHTKESTEKEKDPLWEGFIRLKQHLEGLQDAPVDSLELLQPFLQVICSGNSTGLVVALALGSVEKFLKYGILNSKSPNISLGMNTLVIAVFRCRYLASSLISDEMVFWHMLQVFEAAFISECGQTLSGGIVCKMIEPCLNFCYNSDLSEMLKKSAQNAMINMITTIFERLKNIEDEWSFIDSSPDSTIDVEQIHMNTPNAATSLFVDGVENGQIKAENNRHDSYTTSSISDVIASLTDNGQNTILKPYGILTIREILHVLISLLNPHEPKNTEYMRITALRLVNVAFEVGGKSIGRFETIRSLVTDNFCKYVFQLVKTNHVSLLSPSLRVIATVFDTMGPYLKLQQELFLFFLIQKLSPTQGSGSHGVQVDVSSEGVVSFISKQDESESPQDPKSTLSRPEAFKKSTIEHTPMTPEVRGLLLEYLLQFVRQENFMVNLWYNYDCDLTCGDLFEELVQFLCKNAFPDPQSYSITNHHTLCLDAICMFINQMADRTLHKESNEDDYVVCEPNNIDELLESKRKKRLVLEGAKKFNESPKNSISFLIENGIIIEDENGKIHSSLAQFLRTTQQLDKKALGEYLGKPDNLDLLKVYMRQFDFRNIRMDEALRMILETFRLPGESQQILRVTDTFAATFFEAGAPEIENIEASEVLAYSVIMLNTDQHNPQVRSQSRMSVEQYIRNLSGVNNKGNFPKEYLTSIYNAIQRDEILMPEEHEGALGFNYAWKQLQHRLTGPFIQCTTSMYDNAMFKVAWKPLVAAISCAFNVAIDDNTLEKAVIAFRHCAMLAAHYGLNDAFDSIIVNLATTTGLLENPMLSVPDPIVDVAGQKYTVSKLAVRFGRNYKGQLAAVVLFSVVTHHGDSLKKSWTKVLEIIKNLFLNSLLPNSMLRVEDFLSRTRDIPLKPKVAKASKQTVRRDGSLLSTLSSYLLSPYASDEAYSRDPTEEEVEMTMCAVDCVSACKLQELFSDVTSFSLETQKHLLTAVRLVGYNIEEMKKSAITIPYDPVAALFLEFMVTITIRNAEHIEDLWSYAADYILGILSFSEKQSVLVVERTVVGLLRLCICAAARNVMLENILEFLCILRSFPPSVTQTVAEQIMAGATNLSSVQSNYRNDPNFCELIVELKNITPENM